MTQQLAGIMIYSRNSHCIFREAVILARLAWGQMYLACKWCHRLATDFVWTGRQGENGTPLRSSDADAVITSSLTCLTLSDTFFLLKTVLKWQSDCNKATNGTLKIKLLCSEKMLERIKHPLPLCYGPNPNCNLRKLQHSSSPKPLTTYWCIKYHKSFGMLARSAMKKINISYHVKSGIVDPNPKNYKSVN